MAKVGGLFRRIATALRSVPVLARRLLKIERYRPEEHYMRGPGPKTREKMKPGNGASA